LKAATSIEETVSNFRLFRAPYKRIPFRSQFVDDFCVVMYLTVADNFPANEFAQNHALVSSKEPLA
jgi:hypothetical protein